MHLKSHLFGAYIRPPRQSRGDAHGQGCRECSCMSGYASVIAQFVQNFTRVHSGTE